MNYGGGTIPYYLRSKSARNNPNNHGRRGPGGQRAYTFISGDHCTGDDVLDRMKQDESHDPAQHARDKDRAARYATSRWMQASHTHQQHIWPQGRRNTHSAEPQSNTQVGFEEKCVVDWQTDYDPDEEEKKAHVASHQATAKWMRAVADSHAKNGL